MKYLSVFLLSSTLFFPFNALHADCTSNAQGSASLNSIPQDNRCQAPVDIQVNSGASVNAQQELRLYAPSIVLQAGFKVAAGGQFYAGGDFPGAARLLTQATFGPTQKAIDHLIELGSYQAWLDEQFALPFQAQLPAVKELDTRMCSERYEGYTDSYNPAPRHQIWWENVVQGEDQLRQRVAFALSQIFVISDIGALDNYQYGVTDYWDTLAEHAFGNYRDLLEAVTLHPMMGEWLSSIRNRKADTENNIHPDENYAREVLQLFSIGLYQLNLDGSLKKDSQGLPIPTYGQDEIKAFARVFTGLIYDGVGDEYWRDPWEGGLTTRPMVAYEAFHDTGSKQLLNGYTLPAGGSTLGDISLALDNIFNHPNVGPFISKQLIQRLVTSNPTPAYIARVASVFNDNGKGVRGDLKAVVRAILLDNEARRIHPATDNFGKLREPLLRYAHLWRAFGIDTKTRQGDLWDEQDCGQPSYQVYWVWWLLDFRRISGEAILGAPSVFNFYLPSFVPPGPVGDAGLVAPEFQIATESWLTGTANPLNWQILAGSWGEQDWSFINFDAEAAWGQDPKRLLQRLNNLLMNGQMSTQEETLLLDHLNYMQTGLENVPDIDIVRDAVLLLSNSPNYLIQK